jgi:hypothetical protein
VGVVFRGHREGPLLKKQAGAGENPNCGYSTKDLKSGSGVGLRPRPEANEVGEGVRKDGGAFARLIRLQVAEPDQRHLGESAAFEQSRRRLLAHGEAGI